MAGPGKRKYAALVRHDNHIRQSDAAGDSQWRGTSVPDAPDTARREGGGMARQQYGATGRGGALSRNTRRQRL